MTQEQLAQATGVTQAEISCWEHGHYIPQLKTVQRLARALNCKVDDLIADQSAVQIGAGSH